MIEDGLIADGDRSFKQTLGKGDLLSGKGNNLGFLPIKRSRKLQGQIIAQSVLGQRIAVAIGDLTSRSGDAKLKSAGLLLGLPRRFGIFVHGCICRISFGAGEDLGMA